MIKTKRDSLVVLFYVVIRERAEILFSCSATAPVRYLSYPYYLYDVKPQGAP